MTDEATLASVLDALLRTGCNSARVLNSCDRDGWSLLMSASRCERAFVLLHTETAIDWAYVRQPVQPYARYSMLSEAVFVGDDYGLYALSRLTDEQITECVNVRASVVMHRIVCACFDKQGHPRFRVLQALKRRAGVIWSPDLCTFTVDPKNGALPSVAVQLTSHAGQEFWDLFASSDAPWSNHFIKACNQVADTKWDASDPLRAASIPTHPPLSILNLSPSPSPT
jgi:hypothetical protein